MTGQAYPVDVDALPATAYGTPSHRTITHHSPRCWQCGNRLAEYLTEPFSLRCRRCKAQNRRGDTIDGSTTERPHGAG